MPSPMLPKASRLLSAQIKGADETAPEVVQ